MDALETLKPKISLSIFNPDTKSNHLFGPGIAQLCRGVRDMGSLNAAAKELGMAYSKAWRVMKEAEEALGFQLLTRDGAHGSYLTKEGVALLSMYDELLEFVNDAAVKQCTEIAKGL